MVPYVYISIPRTATWSMHKALKDNFKWQHVPASMIKDEIGQQEWDNAFKFSFVRNPFDRIVSWFSYVKKRGYKFCNMTFKSWVKASCPHHWEHHPWGEKSNPRLSPFRMMDFLACNGEMDFLGRFENIESDFKKVCDTMGIQVELEHVHKSERAHYRDYYDKESIGIVSEICRDDLSTFGYKF